MGQNITGTTNRNVSITETATVGLASQSLNQPMVTSFNYQQAGTAAGQVDTLYAATLTLSGSAATIDLFGGTLKDPAGNALVFARVREFIVTNPDPTATHTVKVSSGAANPVAWLPPAANALVLQPQGTGSVPGRIDISDPNGTGGGNGYIVDGTHKTVTFDPGAFTITINVLICGGSAA